METWRRWQLTCADYGHIPRVWRLICQCRKPDETPNCTCLGCSAGERMLHEALELVLRSIDYRGRLNRKKVRYLHRSTRSLHAITLAGWFKKETTAGLGKMNGWSDLCCHLAERRLHVPAFDGHDSGSAPAAGTLVTEVGPTLGYQTTANPQRRRTTM